LALLWGHTLAETSAPARAGAMAELSVTLLAWWWEEMKAREMEPQWARVLVMVLDGMWGGLLEHRSGPRTVLVLD
jgi:hypothetical protein